jgi:hypothetical protein
MSDQVRNAPIKFVIDGEYKIGEDNKTFKYEIQNVSIDNAKVNDGPIVDGTDTVPTNTKIEEAIKAKFNENPTLYFKGGKKVSSKKSQKRKLKKLNKTKSRLYK